jgi:hypothetical protein
MEMNGCNDCSDVRRHIEAAHFLRLIGSAIHITAVPLMFAANSALEVLFSRPLEMANVTAV